MVEAEEGVIMMVKEEDAEAGEDEAEEGVMVKDEEDHLLEEEDVEVVDVVPEETGEEMVVISRVPETMLDVNDVPPLLDVEVDDMVKLAVVGDADVDVEFPYVLGAGTKGGFDRGDH